MSADDREPLLNTCFRVEIEGLPAAACAEVIFPEARIVDGGRRGGGVQYGPLTLRRGFRESSDWYRWWDSCRGGGAPLKKQIAIVLMDRQQADRTRWTFAGTLPAAYTVSPLNATQAEVVIETLEVSVAGLTIASGGSRLPSPAKPAAHRLTRTRARRRRTREQK
jgi:phage tail-like protein